MTHKKSHDTEIHYVVVYNVANDVFKVDSDGTQYWIRTLFQPNCQTWCNDCVDYVKDSTLTVAKAERKLTKLFGGRND